MEHIVELRHVTKKFGPVTAVEDVTLLIQPGEFITLLGPSGCGKTTMLRMISGLETPTAGSVVIDGRDVTHLPPYRRDVNQVFQSYALFPHLSVADNIAFGLRMKKTPAPEVKRRVAAAVEMVSLSGMEQRRPQELSGGQRQRVALARALVCEPKVLLLDEPLAALDATLRRAMQVELKRLQHRLGITFLYVTHDQEEALTMSDRIAVVHAGKIEQLGPVMEIYHQPRTAFVARFIGQANIFPAAVMGRRGDTATLRLDGGVEIALPANRLPSGADRLLVSVRPEKVLLRKTQTLAPNTFPARVRDELFMGAVDQLTLVTEGGLELTAVAANQSAIATAFHEGDRLFCSLHPDDIVVIRPDE